MRVPDRCVADLRDQGYLVFEGFLDGGELEAAQEGLWLHYPRPEEYFADPAAHAWLATDQWAGIIGGPWRSWNLNRLAFQSWNLNRLAFHPRPARPGGALPWFRATCGSMR
jgi:hypothetical protein